MKLSPFLHAGIFILTVFLAVNLWQNQRFAWVVKKAASQTLQRGKVKSLSGLLIELSQLDSDLFPSSPASARSQDSIPDNSEDKLVDHLKRLIATGDAPARLLDDPINRWHLEVSGLATVVDTSDGILWVGRVSGYHGPIIAFAMNGEILHVAWTTADAMVFYVHKM